MYIHKDRFLRRRSLAQFALGMAMVLLAVTAPLAHGAIRFDVIVGYSGVSPRNAWHPLTCELQNSGPSVEAIIEIASDRGIQAPTRRMKIELPSNTTKRVIIPDYSSIMLYSSQSVRLLDLKGKVIAEPNFVGQQTEGRPVLGFLSKSSVGVPAMPEMKARGYNLREGRPLAVRMDPELFPDNPLVLDGLPSLYLNSERAAALSEPQFTALLAWIQNGGHLIIGVEQAADLTSREWMRSLLPFEPGTPSVINGKGELYAWVRDYVTSSEPDPLASVRNRVAPPTQNNRNRPVVGRNVPQPPPTAEENIVLSDDSGFDSATIPIVNGRVKDGKILVGTADSPLVIQAQRGRGKISVLTFSPEREPFLSWKHREWFWAKISGVPSSVFKRTDGAANYGWQSTDGMFGWLVDSKQVHKLPLHWLLLLLAAYLVIIGPFDQYILKKLKRQMLTWITFPVYVIAFSGLIYFIGFYLRAGDLECNELSIVDVLPNSQLGRQIQEPDGTVKVGGDAAVLRGQTYCSIYSPVNSRYPLKSSQPFAALRGESAGMNGDSSQNMRAEIMQRANGFEAQAFVAVWTSKLFVCDWLDASVNPLAVTIKPQGRDWRVTVENATGHAIKDVRIVLRQRIFKLGDGELPPGKSEYTLTTERGTALFQFVNGISPTLMSAGSSRNSNFREAVVSSYSTADSSIAASFPSLFNTGTSEWNSYSAPARLDLAPFVAQGCAILLAFDANRAISAPLAQFKSRRSRSDTLYRMVIPMPTSVASAN